MRILMPFLLFANAVFAQNNPSASAKEDKIYELRDVSKAPVFPGGEQAMLNFFAENINYPAQARENKIQGTVRLLVAIKKDGAVGEVRVVAGIGAGCDKEAVRVAKTMPQWTPAERKGNPVSVFYPVSVRFQLDAQTKPSPIDSTARKDIRPSPEPNATADSTKVYEIADVERPPSFPGGESAMLKFMAENIKYPTFAREQGIQGTVAAEFVVEKDGSISSMKILKGLGGGCDEEFLRVLSLMPKWTPGEKGGEAVRVRSLAPARFRLEGKSKKKKKN